MYINEFSLSDRSFKFFSWSEKGKSKFMNTISDSFKMSFYVAFSKYKFYGIIGVECTRTSQHFIHFLSEVLKERKMMNSNEIRQLIIDLDNSSIHKTEKALKFIVDSKIPMITILPYEPSLNPVEKFILAIKSKLKQKKQIEQ